METCPGAGSRLAHPPPRPSRFQRNPPLLRVHGARHPLPLEKGPFRTAGRRPMKRSPFQGVSTVVRFNWHLYAIAFGASAALLVLAALTAGWLALACLAV